MSAQYTAGSLKYEVATILPSDWSQLLSKDTTSMLRSYEIESLAHWVVQQTSGKENQIWEYAFDSIQVRIFGNPVFRGETFDTYSIRDLSRVVHHFHKGDTSDLRIDTLDYRTKLAHYEYTIQTYPDSLLEFGGYPCYPAHIQEVRWFGADKVQTNYELLLTPAIRFSPSILLDFGKHLLYDCPVLVRASVEGLEGSYTLYRLQAFDPDLEIEVFTLPVQFRKK